MSVGAAAATGTRAIVAGMGGARVRTWEADGFVWIAVAPHGRNEYAACLFVEDATRVLASLARAVREAGEG